MKYRDLIQFESLETTIAINQADSKDKAISLVSSYVISDEMADRFSDILCPQLQFHRPADNKGILIVGNYGTGKSHLMSLISAVAEHGDLVDSIRNPRIKTDITDIAGKFKVVRTELSTKASLRDVLCGVLERYLQTIGIPYQFPATDSVMPNTKIAIEEMMALFEEHYPEHGLLLVVDEMLDYLRSRMAEGNYTVIADFNFLRELGEVAKHLKFRFMAGLQVSLFDSPEFQFVADSLRRVKDRFEQVVIARRDIKFVVAERLLAKTAEQQVKIRQHLTPFVKFYGDMGDRLDEFVRLFPIHPDYIDVFEMLTVVEKRQVMKSLTLAIRAVLDRDVPEDNPGLIAFDHYWSILKEDASFRNLPDIRQVIDCSNKLESLIETGLSKKAVTKALALQIIRALSVYRLAVGSIESAIGLTSENLRDRLCIYDPIAADMGGEPAEDMKSAIETALRLIRKTVNGQFMSSTERDGGMYYLDIRKTVDYEAQIEKKASTLDGATLDNYYFSILQRVLGCSDQTIVTGYKIWQHQLTWLERKASRLGYLFFGAPNDRSTAQPPREFYLYFLPHYREAEFKDDKRGDEVFFRLDTIDASFDQTLRYYGAALSLAGTESGDAKRVYADRGEANLKTLVAWLQENLTTAYNVTYQGKKQPFMAWLKGNPSTPNLSRLTVGDLVNVVSSVCLSPWFSDRAPEYPTFSVVITEENRTQAAQDTLHGIADPSKRTKQGIAVLSALELLDGDRLVPEQSRYTRHLLNLLQGKGQGQVLNYHELIQEAFGVPYMEIDRYRLEPEWVAVVIAALVREFNYTLVIPGKQFDGMKLTDLANTAVKDLINFQYVKPPKDYDIDALKALCTLLGLETGKAVVVTQGGKNADDGTTAIAKATLQLLEKVVTTQQVLAGKLSLFGKSVLGDAEQSEYRNRLKGFKEFLESLQHYNTPSKLKNFQYDATAVSLQHTGLDTLREVDRLRGVVTELGEVAAYLSQAELILPHDSAWLLAWRTHKESIYSLVVSPSARSNPALTHQLSNQLQQLKRDYIQEYQTLHVRSRLGNQASTQKQQLQSDSRLKDLRNLASIKVVNVDQLNHWDNELAKIKECYKLTDSDLQSSPLCPHCGFKPSNETYTVNAEDSLQDLDAQLDRILQDWTDRLSSELNDPTTQENVELLSSPKYKKLITTFCTSSALPQPVSNEFVQAVNEVLSSLHKIAIAPSDLIAALTDGGMPTHPDEFESRFKNYLNGLVKGKERKNARIFVEDKNC